MEDNLNSVVCTSGKIMAYGRGEIFKKFLNGGLKHNKEEYFVHKNSHDFTEDKINKKDIKKTSDDTIEKSGSPRIPLGLSQNMIGIF